jgi:hypothetical protein
MTSIDVFHTVDVDARRHSRRPDQFGVGEPGKVPDPARPWLQGEGFALLFAAPYAERIYEGIHFRRRLAHPSPCQRVYFGHRLPEIFLNAAANRSSTIVSVYLVASRSRDETASFDDIKRPSSIEEKPAPLKSEAAVTELHIYEPDVTEVAQGLKSYVRGELEITGASLTSIQRGTLEVQ